MGRGKRGDVTASSRASVDPQWVEEGEWCPRLILHSINGCLLLGDTQLKHKVKSENLHVEQNPHASHTYMMFCFFREGVPLSGHSQNIGSSFLNSISGCAVSSF